ncbi:MAG TPA: MBL fold metallo-hydrolase [Ramlibacter sp.]|uniref:MBL fold metallo-hydrolase n=1 Tax=Ramlibacter sp. TaxID=1917967 RepID=UPI002B67C27F|nr:MBL fold metallo-hydrolase [Ramlibacter sp.]HVZ43270.1 MBL fold metallo-hydrolase [Ramlibacter sp.]
MERRVLLAVLAACALAAACAGRIDPVEAVLRHCELAMRSARLKTLQYTATGTGSTFGQAYQAGMAWPRIDITMYARWVDYEHGALREDTALRRAEPTGGGSLPPMGAGERRTSAWLKGDHAWNVSGTTATAAPAALDARVHDLWTTPQGVIKAALARSAGRSLRTEGDLQVVTFADPGRLRATVWIGADGLVRRVDSVLSNPVSGDTPVTTLYSDWRDFSGLKFPTRIVQYKGGFQVLDLAVEQVEGGAPVAIDVPQAVSAFKERVDVQKLAEGVWFLGGGSHNSVLVEFSDHLMLVESPLYDGRAQAVIAAAKELVPGKRIAYAVNTHHHFDHSGGLRAAAAEGATLVVSEEARGWFERAFAQANTVHPDALAQSGRKPVFLAVNGQRTFSDAMREVDLFQIEDSLHARGSMIVWLPKERLLIEADAFTPRAQPAAAAAQPDGAAANLVANIERLHLDVERVVPLHGRVVPAAELYTAAGREP